mmetsp:Transcript_12361/g.28625  ORF Transcript_12361/g.28625 Transcript_12361/m.28625 type:complete len:212 (+) Transcript_12361:298-933(+)
MHGKGTRFGGSIVSFLDFVVGLSRHASTHDAKDAVGDPVNHVRNFIVRFRLGKDGNDSNAQGTQLEAIVTADEPDIILVQTQVVVFSNHNRCGAHGHTGATAGLQTHAGERAVRLAQIWSSTAAASKVSLTTTIVRPTRAWFNMIQRFMTHKNLDGAETEHGCTPTKRLRAWRLTHGNHVRRFLQVRKFAISLTILACFLLLREGPSRQAL